ncbi:MAG TPA: formate--tetrahydrofolate ligase [Trueperaceae bacterium]|nr:formate--tetrahydrofolate ligase [Trueperaceae bacterium]
MATRSRPIEDVARDLGIRPRRLVTLGRHKAKVGLASGEEPSDARPPGRLVLVSAVTPTKAGEGKTTVSVGLADGLRRLGVRAALCLREPSLGPVFGIKGGGTGGGKAQVEPADDINLHFTGDLHAVTAAHNLLAALVDNELHFGGDAGLAPERVTWPRVLDVNDRALRDVVVAAGRRGERATRFDITAASEVMAVMALARSLEDLRDRLARIVVGTRDDGSPVTARDLGAVDAMMALLKDALEPNLVQTREGTPAFVHLGPFGNIAHGCSSVAATRLALEHADVVVTEAGFGFELGGEKFLHIKCRQAGLWPRAVVLVATVQALKAHGAGDLGVGLGHLDRQLANVAAFGLPAVVAVNVFPGDTEEELRAVEAHAAARAAGVARVTAFRDGGVGGVAIAERLMEVLDASELEPPRPAYLYEERDDLVAKLRAVARRLYGAADVRLTAEAEADLATLHRAGLSHLPLCVAKTHLSFSGDPRGGGLAEGFTLEVKELRASAGAGFVVALAGDIVTMPALPREPAAKRVRVAADGSVTGLMQGDAKAPEAVG